MRLFQIGTLIVVLAGSASLPLAAKDHWVTTWGCAPQLTEPHNLPPVPLKQSTLRQFVRTSIGGKQLRVRFSNAYGTNAVNIGESHIAIAMPGASAVAGEIKQGTDRKLTFRGVADVVIPAGEAVFSDPVELELPPLADVAISIYFGDISATTINGHPASRTTSFILSSNAVSVAAMPDATKTTHWYIITGIEVLADSSSRAIVVLGDSITDGRGSTTDGNNRWPDQLAERLSTNASTRGVAMVNMGIGGNGVFGGLGPAAIKRFDRDVLDQNGVRWLIVFEGVNDIGGAKEGRVDTIAADLIRAYTGFAEKARQGNLLAYGATITPFGGNNYYTPAREAARQTVNAWLRTNTVFDGVIDFDAVVRDPVTVTNLLSTYDPGDHLHLNSAGYKAMADAVDLKWFER